MTRFHVQVLLVPKRILALFPSFIRKSPYKMNRFSWILNYTFREGSVLACQSRYYVLTHHESNRCKQFSLEGPVDDVLQTKHRIGYLSWSFNLWKATTNGAVNLIQTVPKTYDRQILGHGNPAISHLPSASKQQPLWCLQPKHGNDLMPIFQEFQKFV